VLKPAVGSGSVALAQRCEYVSADRSSRGLDPHDHRFGNAGHYGSHAIRVPNLKGATMPFKFFVGQTVEYRPIGEKAAGLYKIVRLMPEEERAFDLRYLIQSAVEAYARNVPECDLSSDVGPESDSPTTKPHLSRGSHRHARGRAGAYPDARRGAAERKT
jgi:hypothetical protein